MTVRTLNAISVFASYLLCARLDYEWNVCMDLLKIGLSRISSTVPASFSSFYLTLIGLIQGVALSLLAAKIPTFISTQDLMGPPKLIHDLTGLEYSLLTFIVVVVVWHEYVLAAQEFWWGITWWDSLIPFLLGMGEYLMIHYIGTPYAWFFAASFTAFAGYFAYVNYDRWLTREDFEDPAAFELFRTEVIRGRFQMMFLALANVSSAGLLAIWPVEPLAAFLGVIYGASLIRLISKRLSWQRSAMELYRFSRAARGIR